MKKYSLVIIFYLMCFQGFSQNFKFGKVSKEELSEKVHPLDSTAKAAYLNINKEVFIEYTTSSGWQLVTLVTKRIKIYSKEAAEYATEEVSLFKRGGTDERLSDIKAYTYNLENGKVKKEKLQKSQVFETEISRNWFSQKFTMPNVKNGSVLEFKYRKTSPYFQFLDVINMQYFIPIKNIEVLVRIPEYFKYKTHFKGYLQSNFDKTVKNKKIRYSYRQELQGYSTNNKNVINETIDLRYVYYQFNKQNIPAIESNESNMPPIKNYLSSVKFELQSILMPSSKPIYYATSWEDVAKRIFKTAAFGEELQKSSYYKNDLEALLAGETSEVEKAMAIFQFVKSKIKWNNINGKYAIDGVRSAYKNGTGNVAEINLILTSMLRSAGLNANPVLISTRSNGLPLYPTINGFNYVVSSVSFSNNTFALFDATAPYSMPNMLPIRTINWNGRLVKKDGTSISIDLIPKSISSEDNTISVKINEEGSVVGMMRSKFTNYNAYNYRLSYNHVKESELQTLIEEKNNIEIENFRVTNKNNSKPISQLVKFNSEDLIETIGGKLYIEPLLFLTKRNNPFKLEKRNYPVDFIAPWQEKNTVTIQVPEGYKVETIPEASAISMSDSYGVFKYQVIAAGNKVKVLSSVRFNKAIITPDYYPELKEFYNRMVKKQTEKIVLVKE